MFVVVFTRVLALAWFIAVSVMDPKYLPYVRREEWQLVIGAFTVFIALFFDLWTGLLLMAALFVLYFRMNREYIQRMGWIKEDVSSIQEIPSLSDALLESAQNNIVSAEDYKKEMIGFKSVHGEEVYGVQGLNDVMPGYTNDQL